MLYHLLSALVLAVAGSAGAPHLPLPQSADSVDLLRLESVWNDAHVRGDTVALSNLWAEELVVTVPEMPVMSKADLLRFWRSGRSVISRYETSELRIRVYADAAVVTGRLRRERNFNGRLVADDWRFTKVYVRRGGRWQVVAYQGSVTAP